MDAALRRYLREGQQAGSRYALAQPTRVPSGLAGAQLGQRAGSSIEFKEHREYQLGDDLRRIDWSVYARTDRLHVKLYREEVNPHADILLDGSASMGLVATPKAGAAVALAAVMATAAGNCGYSHNVYLANHGCRPIAGGRDLPENWQGLAFDDTASVDQSFTQMPPAWRARSIRVLISDLLWMSDPLALLQPMAHHAAMVVVLQVLADADAEPPQRGSNRLVDSETGEVRDVYIDAAAQQRYRDALARHQDHWQRAATQTGAVLRTFIAEPLLSRWDLGPLVQAEVLKL